MSEDKQASAAMNEQESMQTSGSQEAKVRIHVSDLRKHFGDLEVLKSISMDVHEGEVVVVIECAVCKEQRRVPLSEYNVRFVDNDKAAADGDYVIVSPDAAMADVLKGCPEGTLVLNVAGERLADDVTPGSGMRLQFPSSRGYTVVLFGDADGDGKISPSDARIALRRSVNLDEKLDWRDKACHVICDGKTAITPEDARMILRASVRLEGGDRGRTATPSSCPSSSSFGMMLTPSPCRTMAMMA